jgi:hypothetical protein
MSPLPRPEDLAFEKHYTCKELGKVWGLSDETIRRMFEDTPGVLRISNPKIRSKRKTRVSMRIPASVAARVHAMPGWVHVVSRKRKPQSQTEMQEAC